MLRGLACASALAAAVALQAQPQKQPALDFSVLRQRTDHFAENFARRTAASQPLRDDFLYLDNGIIRLGIDQSRGGAIGYLSLSSSNVSLLNHHDFGRLVQGSFYSGPAHYDTPDKRCDGSSWDPWPWNPIGGGDAFNHAAVLISVNQTSPTSAVILSRPYQWACDDVPCECTFTQTISLVGAAAEVRLELNNARTDPAGQALYSMTQELPAVYIIGEYCHLFLVNASSPFTGRGGGAGAAAAPAGASITSASTTRSSSANVPVEVNATWPWSNFLPSENWMAFANSSDVDTAFAVGVWGPFHTNTGAGRFFSSPPVACGGQSGDDPTGYIAPWIPEILDANISFSYNFSLILGTLADVQAYAQAKHEAGLDQGKLPDYVYGPGTGRAHCTFAGGLVDGGWPVPETGLAVPLTAAAANGFIVGPFTTWEAPDLPAVYVNGSWPTDTTLAVAFNPWGEGQPCTDCFVTVNVKGGTGYQLVPVPLSSSSSYTGRMSRLALRPSTTAQPGVTVVIKSITSTASGITTTASGAA